MDYTPVPVTQENSKGSNTDPRIIAIGMGFAILLMAVFVIIVVKLCYSTQNTTHPSTAFTTPIINKLDEVEVQLQQLRNAPITEVNQQSLASAMQNIASLQQSLQALADKTDVKTISMQLNTVKVDVDNQMGELKTLVNENVQHKKVISMKDLPFDCLSIDVIGGSPMLSVNFQHMILPLLIGDTLASWQVIQLSMDAQEIEFRDPHGELVTLTLHSH